MGRGLARRKDGWCGGKPSGFPVLPFLLSRRVATDTLSTRESLCFSHHHETDGAVVQPLLQTREDEKEVDTEAVAWRCVDTSLRALLERG